MCGTRFCHSKKTYTHTIHTYTRAKTLSKKGHLTNQCLDSETPRMCPIMGRRIGHVSRHRASSGPHSGRSLLGAFCAPQGIRVSTQRAMELHSKQKQQLRAILAGASFVRTLAGPPGCGKTFALEQACADRGMRLITVENERCSAEAVRKQLRKLGGDLTDSRPIVYLMLGAELCASPAAWMSAERLGLRVFLEVNDVPTGCVDWWLVIALLP